MAIPGEGSGLRVFYSYSHKDSELRNELGEHLASLSHEALISEWHDSQIEPGHPFEDKIKEHLNSADVILLLVSPSFIRSQYCYNIEMPEAMTRHNNGTARVIPIVLRPCDWRGSPFGALQALPTGGKPVVQWDNRDAAFLDVAMGIRTTVQSLLRHRPIRPAKQQEAYDSPQPEAEKSLLQKCLSFLHDFAVTTCLLINSPSRVRLAWSKNLLQGVSPMGYFCTCVLLGVILTLIVSPPLAPFVERAQAIMAGTWWEVLNLGVSLQATNLAELASSPRPINKIVGYSQTIFWILPSLLIVLAVAKLIERSSVGGLAKPTTAQAVFLYYVGLRELFVGLAAGLFTAATLITPPGAEHITLSLFNLSRSIVEVVMVPLALVQATIPSGWRGARRRHRLILILGYALAVLALDAFHYFYLKYGSIL